MPTPENSSPTPEANASRVFEIFKRLVELNVDDPWTMGRLNFSPVELITQRKNLLLELKFLVDQTAATPYYKARLLKEMFNENDEYIGKTNFYETADEYFGIESEGELGIFDKDGASGFEAGIILVETGLLMDRFQLEAGESNNAVEEAQVGRQIIRDWVNSYDEYYDEPLLKFLDNRLKMDYDPIMEMDIKRLRVLLKDYNLAEPEEEN